MFQSSLTERITRSLAYMLRHQPEEFDLELDEQGYGDLEDVVCALNERLGEPIQERDVRAAIESGDRPRYEIEGGRIRALYGHSIEIDPGEPSEPPELLYIGVGTRDAGRAERFGLRGGRRTFLHLALTYEDARETGRRLAPDYAVITVHAREAHEEGIAFYDRRSLFLAEHVPTDFLEVADYHDDGEERRPPLRSAGDRRSRNGGEGEGRRGRGPGRREERDAWGERGGRGEHHRRGAGDEAHSSRGERPREERAEPRHAPAPRSPARAEAAPRRPQAPAAPARSEPRRKAAPEEPAVAAERAGDFGLGIFEPAARRSRAEREEEPRPAPAPQPEPEPEHEPEAEEGSGGFGAGIL